MRKDTSAARIALARKRQRAAAIVEARAGTATSASAQRATSTHGIAAAATTTMRSRATPAPVSALTAQSNTRRTGLASTPQRPSLAIDTSPATIHNERNGTAVSTAGIPKYPAERAANRIPSTTASQPALSSSSSSSPVKRRDRNTFTKRLLSMQQRQMDYRMKRVSPTSQTMDDGGTLATSGLTTTATTTSATMTSSQTLNRTATATAAASSSNAAGRTGAPSAYREMKMTRQALMNRNMTSSISKQQHTATTTTMSRTQVANTVTPTSTTTTVHAASPREQVSPSVAINGEATPTAQNWSSKHQQVPSASPSNTAASAANRTTQTQQRKFNFDHSTGRSSLLEARVNGAGHAQQQRQPMGAANGAAQHEQEFQPSPEKSRFESPLEARRNKITQSQFQYSQQQNLQQHQAMQSISQRRTTVIDQVNSYPSQQRYQQQEQQPQHTTTIPSDGPGTPSWFNQTQQPQHQQQPDMAQYSFSANGVVGTAQQMSHNQSDAMHSHPPFPKQRDAVHGHVDNGGLMNGAHQVRQQPQQYGMPSNDMEAELHANHAIENNNASTDIRQNAQDRSGATSPGVQQLSSMLLSSSPNTSKSNPNRRPSGHGGVYSKPPLHSHSPGRMPRMHKGSSVASHDSTLQSHPKFINREATGMPINSKASIMLRSYCTMGTIETRKVKDGAETKILAKQSGRCLGRQEETLIISKIDGAGEGNEAKIMTGDTVTFSSPSSKGRKLGVYKAGRSGSQNRYEVGFYNSTAGPCEHWMVLPNLPGESILLGRASMAKPEEESKFATQNFPVSSGRPIIMRNRYCGGILSIDGKGALAILTDSYQQQQNHGDSDTSSGGLLDRLQDHSKVIPTEREAFQIISSHCPPLPPWIMGMEHDERLFLTGSYLLHPGRNQRSAKIESTLFHHRGLSHIAADVERIQESCVGSLSSEWKEHILLDEVIGSFLGLEGRHIRMKQVKAKDHNLADFEFNLFNAYGIIFDVSLRNLVEQILPLSTSFVRVRNFVGKRHPGYECGKVMHAFCEAVDQLLKEYTGFVMNLESKFRDGDSLTMKNLYFQITPSLHSMTVLENAINAISDKKGGALLNALHSLGTRAYLGDVVADRVLTIILDRSSVPYMEMMASWVQKGVLRDPYSEFMISPGDSNGSGNNSIGNNGNASGLAATASGSLSGIPRNESESVALNGDEWAGLFGINEEHVLQRVVTTDALKHRILTSGKYWTAIRVCRIHGSSTAPAALSSMPPLLNQSDHSAISSHIDRMYQTASRELMQLLFDKFNVTESLLIVKRFFLLDQGEFLTNFLESATGELIKDTTQVATGRVQQYLRTAIQQAELPQGVPDDLPSYFGQDQQRRLCQQLPMSLRCRFANESLLDQIARQETNESDQAAQLPWPLTGVESLTIDFARIPFPLSLLLSRQSMQQYQTLFRQIFLVKHVENRLASVWDDLQSLKRIDFSLRGALGPTYLLRQRMAHCLQNLSCYLSFDVVESHWIEMQSALLGTSKVTANGTVSSDHTVDDILRIHDEFLQRTIDASLLTSTHLLASLMKLLKTCALFAEQITQFMKTTGIVEENMDLAAERQTAVQANLNVGVVSKDKRSLHQSLTRLREETVSLTLRQSYRVDREVSSPAYQQMIHQFGEVFTTDLADFMTHLNSHTATGVMANLGVRLDYNGFVAASIAARSTPTAARMR